MLNIARGTSPIVLAVVMVAPRLGKGLAGRSASYWVLTQSGRSASADWFAGVPVLWVCPAVAQRDQLPRAKHPWPESGVCVSLYTYVCLF